MTSSAAALRSKIALAPVTPTVSEESREVDRARRQENAVEPELVAAATNLGRFAEIHRTRATPGDQLPVGLLRSCTGFFLNTRVLDVVVDSEQVMKDMEYLKKFVSIAYHVGGKQSLKTSKEWLGVIETLSGEEFNVGRDLGRGFFHVI